MVNFRQLADRAKNLVGKRGGTDALKEDAAELKDIATGEGSVTDKAKQAADALKEPGKEGGAKAEAERPGPAGEREGERPKPGGESEGERTKPAEGRNGGGGAA